LINRLLTLHIWFTTDEQGSWIVELSSKPKEPLRGLVKVQKCRKEEKGVEMERREERRRPDPDRIASA
jgi:hypothetical protein